MLQCVGIIRVQQSTGWESLGRVDVVNVGNYIHFGGPCNYPNDAEGRRRTAKDGEWRLMTANDSLNYLEY